MGPAGKRGGRRIREGRGLPSHFKVDARCDEKTILTREFYLTSGAGF